jgi:hypothetical protein
VWEAHGRRDMEMISCTSITAIGIKPGKPAQWEPIAFENMPNNNSIR